MRARKQRQTREAIHRAAVDLALENGPDAATVADISARANVSTRTFFNYFPTKEDAIVGIHEGMPSDDELDDFRSGTSDDIIHDLLDLLVGVFSPDDEELMTQTRALLTEHPSLIQRQWARLLAIEQRTARAVAERMRGCRAYAHLSDVESAALVLVVACSNVLRLSIRKTIELDSHPDHLPHRIDETLHLLREVLRIQP